MLDVRPPRSPTSTRSSPSIWRWRGKPIHVSGIDSGEKRHGRRTCPLRPRPRIPLPASDWSCFVEYFQSPGCRLRSVEVRSFRSIRQCVSMARPVRM